MHFGTDVGFVATGCLPLGPPRGTQWRRWCCWIIQRHLLPIGSRRRRTGTPRGEGARLELRRRPVSAEVRGWLPVRHWHRVCLGTVPDTRRWSSDERAAPRSDCAHLRGTERLTATRSTARSPRARCACDLGRGRIRQPWRHAPADSAKCATEENMRGETRAASSSVRDRSVLTPCFVMCRRQGSPSPLIFLRAPNSCTPLCQILSHSSWPARDHAGAWCPPLSREP